MADIVKNQQLLGAGSADASGYTVQVSQCNKLTMSVFVTVTAATLVGTVALTGTNDDARALDITPLSLPTLATGKELSVLPTGFTFTPTTGLLAVSSPAIGTYEVILSYSDFPKWIRPVYDFTSGGGTVSVSATVSAWSV